MLEEEVRTAAAILPSLPQSPDWPKNEKKRSRDPRCFMNLKVFYSVFRNLNHTFMFESGVFAVIILANISLPTIF